uniref:Uncharacterized protein n=1 Tax=Helianthus annuus TaxID=4232 RepID=A0A251TF70_HELAN
MLMKNPGVPIFLSVFLVTLFLTADLFTRWVDVMWHINCIKGIIFFVFNTAQTRKP